MRVLTVCKMNQARSAFAEAVCRHFLSNLEINSAGVQAIQGAPFLHSVTSLSRKWGIAISEGGSKTLDLSLELLEAELIICAEAWMKADSRIDSVEGRVVSYEDFVPDSSFMPFDPERLTGRTLETELAKVAWVNLRALRDLWSDRFFHEIIAVIPETEFHVDSAIAYAKDRAHELGAVIVDADLRSPNPSGFRRFGLSVGSFEDFKSMRKFNVLSGLTEKAQPEAELLSLEWRDLLVEISTQQPLVLVTAPQLIPTGPLPDPFLASIWASEIQIIRR